MKTDSLNFDARALREKILDLAMHGKLVKQDPNDVPDSELLDKIKAEREQLIKEKKIRKSKPLPPITDDEKPFGIPDSWEWVRLGDIFTVFNGKAFKPNDWAEEGIPIVRIQNLNNPLAEYHLYNGPIEERYHLKGGELLFAWSGTPGTSFGAHVWKDQEAVLNQHIFKLGFDQKSLNKNFLKDAMNFRILKLIDEAHGSAGLRHITKKMFEKTTIPLPPLSEQSRIAAKVAQLFALLRKVESSTKQYQNLQILLKEKVLDLAMRGKLVKQEPNDEPASVLLENIKTKKLKLVKEKKIKKSKSLPPITDDEKPFEIPDSWEWVRFGNVIELVSGRDIPKKDHLFKNSPDNTPYITGASNIDSHGNIRITEWVNAPSVVVNRGTLLLSVKGTIGKIACLNLPEAHIARQLMGIRNLYKLNLDYQKYFLENYVSELKTRAKSMIPGISRNDLLLAAFPFPPIEEQNRIAAKIEQLFSMFIPDE